MAVNKKLEEEKNKEQAQAVQKKLASKLINNFKLSRNRLNSILPTADKLNKT